MTMNDDKLNQAYIEMLKTKIALENSEELDEDEFEDEDEDGWGPDVQEAFEDTLARVNDLDYEIKNCVKGAMTGCESREELADYIQGIIDDLQAALDQFKD